jgi:MFS family permease
MLPFAFFALASLIGDHDGTRYAAGAEEDALTVHREGVIVGFFSVGAALGSFCSGMFADRYGRRPAVVTGAAAYSVRASVVLYYEYCTLCVFVCVVCMCIVCACVCCVLFDASCLLFAVCVCVCVCACVCV